MLFFGILGDLLIKANFESAPFVLALVLGLLLEIAFRQSLMMSQGDPSIFVTRPICLGIIAVMTFAGVARLLRHV